LLKLVSIFAYSILLYLDDSAGTGSHLSSKLAQDISSQGLANAFTSFNTTYTDTGLFGIYLVTQNRDEQIQLCETTLKHWRNICFSASDADIYRAKNQLKTSLLFQLDSSNNVAEEIGRHMLTYGRRVSPYEIDRMIEAVTVDAVRDAAMRYVYDTDPAVVAVGPIEAWPDYVVLRGMMK
jgi:processing peptidase subunit beta